ncbi:MAG: hypothetical protein ACJ8EQ_03785 [Sphingomicrobium sp.]|jgi:hypothetical protein
MSPVLGLATGALALLMGIVGVTLPRSDVEPRQAFLRWAHRHTRGLSASTAFFAAIIVFLNLMQLNKGAH